MFVCIWSGPSGSRLLRSISGEAARNKTVFYFTQISNKQSKVNFQRKKWVKAEVVYILDVDKLQLNWHFIRTNAK